MYSDDIIKQAKYLVWQMAAANRYIILTSTLNRPTKPQQHHHHQQQDGISSIDIAIE
jgi:hypothetical protein